MRDGYLPGGSADLPGDAGVVGRALAIVVELAGSPADERLPRLVRAVQGLTGADAVTVIVAGPDGRFHPGAASSDAAYRLMQLELSTLLGPSIACRDYGRAVPPTRLAPGGPWPGLAAEAAADGFSTVDAMPMRALGRSIGALASYWRIPYAPTVAVGDLTQALADITAIGVTTDHTVTGYRIRTEQLEHGLQDRTVIEQAKGFLAAYHDITVDDAFTVLNSHARTTGRDIRDVAAEIVSRRPRG